jgi:hypothetical protein
MFGASRVRDAFLVDNAVGFSLTRSPEEILEHHHATPLGRLASA